MGNGTGTSATKSTLNDKVKALAMRWSGNPPWAIKNVTTWPTTP